MTAPALSLTFARGYLVTMRPYLLFVSGITGIVAIALAPPGPLGPTLLLAVAFFLSYGFGQALTDCFQMDTDALSAPYRPLVAGRIRRADVLAVSVIGLVATGVVVARHAPVNVALAALAVLGLATYTYFKRRWWAGPLYNAWIVGVLAVIAHVAALALAGARFVWSPALVGVLTTVFFGYANFVLAGYYKDVSADRRTGYRTLPVVFGPAVAAAVSDVFAMLALAGCAITVRATLGQAGLAPAHFPALALLTAGIVVAVVGQRRLHRTRDEADAYRAIGPVVHAYVLLLVSLAALVRPAWTPGLVAFYAAFAVALSYRPVRQQI